MNKHLSERIEQGGCASLNELQRLASGAATLTIGDVPADAIRKAILIREVEQKFLELFSQGKMNGTVHTCVGQEFSAVAIAGQLQAEDWVTSNHRCHGHFIAKTGNWTGLIDELMGLKSGVCKGIGSSQHLFARGFLSNGPQGALAPVATGIGLHLKQAASSAISVSFIGEGTLGEGVLYEALNLASLWQVPQLFVCENNLYSQSTQQSQGVAGSIRGRAEAFGLRYFEADTWNVAALMVTARDAIEYVRKACTPAFLAVKTYRLNAHSKGDDDRSKEEVAYFTAQDRLNRLLSTSEEWRAVRDEIKKLIDAHIVSVPQDVLGVDEYKVNQLPRMTSVRSIDVKNEKIRMAQALNRAYYALLADGAYMIGEDIADPYGGAFKITKGFSTTFPERALTTPISEAGITGVGIGLALMGSPAYIEIMFGDFTTNVFDQLISNASKFFHMYAFQAGAPVRVRTPMGGKRGYGPTHSQSLEKFVVGIDNVAVFAVTSLEDPGEVLRAINKLPGPAFIVESKVDYGRFLWEGNPDYDMSKVGNAFGTIVLSPLRHQPTVTLVSYGENAREIADHLEDIFVEADCVAELIVPLTLHPLDILPMQRSAQRTGRVIVVEDGSTAFGIGAEILAQLAEVQPGLVCSRIGADPVPIPSVLTLERAMLPSVRKLIAALASATTEDASQ